MTAWYEGYETNHGLETVKKYVGTYFAYKGAVHHVNNITTSSVPLFKKDSDSNKSMTMDKLTASMYESLRVLLVESRNAVSGVNSMFVIKNQMVRAVRPIIDKQALDSFVLGLGSGVKQTINYIDSWDELGFAFPPLGYIATSIGPVFVTRVPRRQYKKGVCAEALDIGYNDVFKQLRKKIGLSVLPKETEVIQNAFFPEYLSDPKHAVKFLQEGQSYGCPVTKNICLGFVPNKKYIGVFYKELYVGNVKEKQEGWDINIVPEAAPFKEELLSALGGLNE